MKTKMSKKALLFHISCGGVTGLLALARNQNLDVKDPITRDNKSVLEVGMLEFM